MEPGVVGARLASSAVVPLVKKLFVSEGPGAGLTGAPVRISALVSFTGEKRALSESDLRKLVRELVRRAASGDTARDGAATAAGVEAEAVTDALVRTLHVLGDLRMDDVQAVRLGHEALSRKLYDQAGGRRLTSHLNARSASVYHGVLESACLHIVHFFTQRSTFVARTLVEQSRQLSDLVARTDLLLERVATRTSEETGFEQRYAAYMAKRHSRLTIYGIDIVDHSREWPLDTAYLNLEVTQQPDHADHRGSLAGGTGARIGWGPALPHRVDHALAAHRRVLLRGVAGSGKTTLIQWLAVSTARQERLEGELAHLSGMVPFVLPLRTLFRGGGGQLPGPDGFLASVGCPLAGSQPPGWAGRVLAAGRGLILVDGIDEVPERERERTRRWICELLTAFPDNRFLVTSRPSAVREEWLGGEEFTELSLSRMRPEDVAVFVARWHEAAEAPQELEQALLDALRVKADLSRLATNPLMCGLICALHRERRGYLPRGRKALYDAALSMMLERRDRERDMETHKGIELDEESQAGLLQKLAYWLIRNGRSEMDELNALELLQLVLPSMPQAAAQGSPADILHFLLVRSGLLREPAAGAVDFVHRTFQDYLAAREAVQERDFDLLVRHAHLDQWEDVVRMAVAHARPDERARILRMLLGRGDEEETLRTRLYLLATACLEHATQLDPAVRTQVEQRAAELIPPRSLAEAKALAEAGPVVLELLPGPEGLEEDEAEAVAGTLVQLGTDSAQGELIRFLDHPSPAVLQQLAGNWLRFDTETYGRDIIEPLVARGGVPVTVHSEKELDALVRYGDVEAVELLGDFTEERIVQAFAGHRLTELTLFRNTVISDLGFLSRFRHLTQLDLDSCPGAASDFSSLADLPLHVLRIVDVGVEITGLRRLQEIAHLLMDGDLPWHGFSQLPDSPALTSLALPNSTTELTGIEKYAELTELNLYGVDAPFQRSDWEAVAALPLLEELTLEPPGLISLEEAQTVLPQVRSLSLLFDDYTPPRLLQRVVEHFPGLTRLELFDPGAESDLSQLCSLPYLARLSLYRPDKALDLSVLPSSVETTVRPRPRRRSAA